jgi:hypothetical protein
MTTPRRKRRGAVAIERRLTGMNKILGVIAAASVLTAAFGVYVGSQTVTSTFHGYRGDAQIWTDRITVEQGKVTDEIDGAGDNPDREAMTLPGTVTGEIFSETAGGLPAHSVVVKGEFVNIYQGQGMEGMVMVEAPPLVFDPTIPSHYGILMQRYDASRGGTQKIPVIVPEKGDYTKIEIAPRPPASIPLGETKKESAVYQLRVDYNQYVTLWMLDGAVAAVHVPAKDETMVDAKYPMLHQKIQMLVKRSM